MKQCHRLSVLVCVLVLSVGCATTRYINKAEKAENDKRWDYAIRYYEKANRKSLIKKRTKQLLKQSKANAGYYYYREAKQAADYQQAFLGNLQTAKVNIDKALQYTPASDEYQRLKMHIETMINQLEDTNSTRLKNAYQLKHDKKYIEAYYICEEVLYSDPENTRAKKLSANIKKKGTAFYLKQALFNEKTSDYNSSLQQIEYACELNADRQLLVVLNRISQKKRAHDLYTECWQIISKGDYLSVLQQVRQMVALDNYNPKYKKLLVRSLTEKIKYHRNKEQHQEIIEAVLEIKRVAADNAILEKKLDSLIGKSVSTLVENAERDTEQGYPGNSFAALLWLDQRGLLPDDKREMLESAKENVELYAIPALYVSALAGDTEQKTDVGFGLSNAILNKLVQDKTLNCNIETKLSTTPLKISEISRAEDDEAPPDFNVFGSLVGSAFELTGYVVSYSFNHTIRKKLMEKPYISHYQSVINPDYIDYRERAEHRRCNRKEPDYDSFGEALVGILLEATVGAVVDAAIDSAFAPPEYIERPVQMRYDYNIESHTVEAGVGFVLELREKQSGKVVLQKRITETVHLNDVYIPGHIKAKVMRDPLDIPDDYTIQDDLLETAVNRAAVEVAWFFKKASEIYQKMAKLSENSKKSREYSVMAAVFQSKERDIAETLWPLTPIPEDLFADSDNGVIVAGTVKDDDVLMNGDRVISVNGININHRFQLVCLLNNSPPNSLIQVNLKRNEDVIKKVIVNPILKKQSLTGKK